AMLAAFIGLRLVSVLGKRTGHERPVGDSFRPGAPEVTAAPAPRGTLPAARGDVAIPAGTDSTLGPALQAVADADGEFHPARFLEGASAAYRLILEAFWAADVRALDGLTADDVQDNFATAIADRDGVRLDNRLVGIDSAAITGAEMVGQMAEVTVRFNARVSIAGAATTTVDVWTFSRHVGSREPNWLLIATDDDTPGDGDLTA
ncbi:MAG: hypothetical protein RL490_1947, partial [Pseudomonadota bacterium]